jgi:hypothetical protein
LYTPQQWAPRRAGFCQLTGKPASAAGALAREGGIPAVSVADFAEPERRSYAAELDEQARRKGVRPIASVDELRADVFESDEELDEFLADLEEFRHEHLA